MAARGPCDLRLDGCGQCSRAGISCFGYRTQEELRFRDQTQFVKHKHKVQLRRVRPANWPKVTLENHVHFVQPVHIGWDVLAKQDFFTNFVFGLAKSYDALGILYQTTKPPDHLVASVDAASLAFYALRQFAPPTSMTKLATERYVSALHLVNSALADPVASLADETLQSILLLDLYEKLVSRKRTSAESWMRHMNGAISLIRARGKENLQTYVGRRLTQRLYTTLVISCAISGMRIPVEMERLRADLSRHFKIEDDPKWALTTLNEQIINFTSDVQAGNISCRDQILARALDFHQSTVALEGILPSCWQPSRVFVGDDALGRQLTLAGSYDIYEGLYFAQVRNVIRTAQINLLLMIERYARPHDLDLVVSARVSIEKSAHAICDSFTQYVVSRDEKSALSWDLASPMQQLGAYTVLFPLYSAAQASRNVRLRKWAQDVLGLVADVGGLAMAQKTADALKQSEAVPAWDVYTMLGSYAIAALLLSSGCSISYLNSATCREKATMTTSMEYTVEQIKPDQAGEEFYLSKYKPFRLEALQTDPQFFGATYEKEVARDDGFWRQRLSRPSTTTFVAIRNQDLRVLSSLTLVRGTQPSSVLAMAAGLAPEERDKDSKTLLHWAVNAVYTAADARRQGIAKAVFEKALAFSFSTAETEGKSCLVSISAREENQVAIDMYLRMGFIELSYVEDGDAVLYMFKARPEAEGAESA
ncbi:hypothetical protein MY3957_008817 [Beauveria namnaoensis]